jgi:drug/metabolite transporter (DMT)-like permease
VLTAFFEPLFFKERLIKINIFYALLCIIGIFLIIPRFELENTVYRGVLWGIFSGMTFAVLTILNRKFSQRLSSLLIAFYQDFFAALLLLPFFFIIKPRLDSKDILLLILLGVFCTAAAHSLFIKGMRYIKAQTASIINSLEPVYGIILAFFLLDEVPSLRIILGGAVILAAALAVTISSGSGISNFYTRKRSRNENKI